MPPPTPASRCEIAGTKTTLDLHVEAGPDTVRVRLDGAPVTVVPAGGRAGAVTVSGTLGFVGRAEGVEFFPFAPVVVADGVVQLGPGSTLGPSSASGSDVHATSIDIGSGFRLEDVSVPCSSLSFIGAGHPAEDTHFAAPDRKLRDVPDSQTGSFRTPTTLDFHTHPGADAHVRFVGSTIVGELERRGSWSLVATLDSVHIGGAQVTGWVRNPTLEKIDGSVNFTGGYSLERPGDPGSTGIQAPDPDGFHGPARLDIGASVYSSAGGGHQWASVRDGTGPFEVILRRGDAWAQVQRGPDVQLFGNAWVSAEAVHPITPSSPAPT